MTAYEHRLLGCRPEPLGSYLKALGVLRLVAEQRDPLATGAWADDGFVLTCSLDDQQLSRFFLADYRPTPIVSPWNNSSGFGPEGVGELHVIEMSTDERLEPYRDAVAAVRRLLPALGQVEGSKEDLLKACRSVLPDACLPWIDAAAVLTDGRAVYPPLLGTGGNDGRLEFSRNFHQRILDVLGLTTGPGHDRAGWLEDSLYGHDLSSGMRGRTPGQFDPGAAGGVNSAPGGAADGVLNPWDWVLLLEGSLLLASGSARRLAAGVLGRAAAPFTVDASAGGYASASDNESSRGELWAPLWSRPALLGEVGRLFAEGRADWRGGHVRSGLDLAKSAASLGVDRGITAFSRHAFVERFGLSTVAVPVGRIAVRERKEVAPLTELDSWLSRVRRGSNPPAAVSRAMRAVDQASFELATRGGGPRLLQVLIETARLEVAVGQSTAFRDRAGVRPVSGLDGPRWLEALDPSERGPELRLAACLTSGRDAAGAAAASGELRWLLRPMRPGARGRPEWTQRPATVTGFGHRPVHVVLASAHTRRVINLQQRRSADTDTDTASDVIGLPTHFTSGYTADLADVADLAAGRLDLLALGDALAACMLLDWPAVTGTVEGQRWAPVMIPPALSVLGPFFAPGPRLAAALTEHWSTRLHSAALRPDPEWPALLAAGRTGPVLDSALRRLRIAGLEPIARDGVGMVGPTSTDLGPLLGAALLCRLRRRDRTDLLHRVCPDPVLSHEYPEEPTASSSPEAQGDQ